MARLNSTFSSANLVDLLEATAPRIDKTTQDAIFNDSTIIRELQAEGGVVQGVTGSDYTWPIEMAKNNTWDARQWAQSIPLQIQDLTRVASETFGEYSGSVVLDQATLDKNSGPEKIVDIAMTHIENLRRTAIDSINTALLNGSGTYPNINGLTTIIPETATSGTLHGINRATSSWWRNQSTASSCSTTDAFGPICIREIQLGNAAAAGGQGKRVFKIAVTDDTTYANALYYLPRQGSMVPQIIANGGSNTATFPTAMKTQEQPMYFHNARCVWDHAAAADAIRFFSTEYVKLLVVKNGYFKVTPRQESEDSFSVRILMGFHGQLVNLNPRRSFVLYNFNA